MRVRWPVGAAAAAALAAIVVACVPTPVALITPSPGTPGATAEPPGGTGLPSPGPVNGGPTASPSFVRPTPTPSPTFLVYEVQAGDSLTSVARLFGTTARSIAYWNRARYPSLDPDSSNYEPDRIEVGWTLLLIPTEVVDEDELPDSTPTPTPPPTPGAGSAFTRSDRRPIMSPGAIVAP
jgi:hypothetical protein